MVVRIVVRSARMVVRSAKRGVMEHSWSWMKCVSFSCYEGSRRTRVELTKAESEMERFVRGLNSSSVETTDPGVPVHCGDVKDGGLDDRVRSGDDCFSGSSV